MTDIDPDSDIELRTVNEHVIVRVPLAGPVTGEWLRCYQRLAHATGVPAQAQQASLYRKLGTSSRNQAVTQARQLGLLEG